MTLASLAPLLLAGLAAASAPVPPPASAAAPESIPLPPPAPGREVVLDSTVLSSEDRRELSLSDVDPETADIVREINRKPGTWQAYLLYTAEDLPERMFHPGFAIRLPARRQARPPELPVLEPAPAPVAPSAPAVAPSPR